MSVKEYSRILAQGEENLKRITDEKGEVVMVMEKRAVDAKREGYFIIQVSSYLSWAVSPPVTPCFDLLGNPCEAVGTAAGGVH